MESKTVSRLLALLESEGFRGQMEGSYGRSYEESRRLGKGNGKGKFARCAFDVKEGKCINRAGWTLSNVNWLLEHPEKLMEVMREGEKIRKRFKTVIFAGMGGSGLGAEVVKKTFGDKGMRVLSLRTTDRAFIAGIEHDIAASGIRKGLDIKQALSEGLKETLVIAVSKSGTTMETLSHRRFFEQLFIKEGVNPLDHIWLMTDPGSAFDKERGTGHRVIRIQLNDKTDIGGRFTSPTTNIFLLPLALSERTPEKAMEKAVDILKKAGKMNDIKTIEKDTYVRLGAFLYDMALKGKDKLTLLVPAEIGEMPRWAEQLFEESLGKDGKGLSVFYGERLSLNALRKIEDNDRVFLRINVGNKKPNDALWKRLKQNGYPTFEINLKDVNSIGGLMLGLQRTVATIAYIWDIRFVDQPAVEGYKNAIREELAKAESSRSKVAVPDGWKTHSSTFRKLILYYHPLIAAGGLSARELEDELACMNADLKNAPAVYAAILSILSKKRRFEAAEIASYGRMTGRLRHVLEDARRSIFTTCLKIPSKLAEGPDKNHSFQQNIEDGRKIFFSTYLTYLKTPQTYGAKYDENLLFAAAIGTIRSMMDNKRNSVLFTSSSDAKDVEEDVNEFFRQAGKHIQDR